jgi:ADP-ribose pyrophosphatase YjhB (NUDIX family)
LESDPMALLTTRDGLEVLNFVYCDTPETPAADSHIPLTWTMIVARYGNGYVSAYNFNRSQWKLPSGGIEPGESPEDCARRELLEESGQIAGELECKGVFKVRDNGLARTMSVTVYCAEIETLQPFVPNDETNRLRIWHVDDPDAMSTELSRWLIEKFNEATG